MRKTLALLVFVCLPFLHGCGLFIVGAAAGSGYLLGEDRRPVQTMSEDERIELRVTDAMHKQHPQAHINVTSFNRMVLVTGEAPSDQAKASIEAIARGTPDVRAVVNEIQVSGNSGMPARANDTYITSKVKGRFLDGRKFNPVHVKVITEAGTVYLMGVVKRQEADAATEIARTTSGVQRVVRVFEYQD
jgi:osmotically-inducible protein OsmY